MKKVIIAIVGILILAIIGFKGKGYMNKKADEQLYQDGFKQIQDHVTNYMVENYEGIEKIEWEGVGVEWRNSPIFGGSMFGNFVISYVRVYASEEKYFKMDFNLSDEMRYDDELEKYIFEDYFFKNLDYNMDESVKSEIYNAGLKPIGKTSTGENEYEFDEEAWANRGEFEGIKKSKNGSTNAKIIYSLKVHELKY
ncbi:hypothetical protein RyT2_12190 [Pseudolactococcus yaeyamensis]